MNFADPQILSGRAAVPRCILACVVHENHFFDDRARQLGNRAFERSRRSVRGHYDDYRVPVNHPRYDYTVAHVANESILWLREALLLEALNKR